MMKWQSRRIGDFIHRVKDSVILEDGIEYKQVTIRMNYKGVVLRGFKKGSDIKTKNQWRVRAGLFILSRIDARNGAFGIIPEELEGAIVSNDFLAYEIDQAEVDIEFFNSFLQSPIFLEACIKASRGNTNRKRVNESFFLDYEVALPTLSEQQRLITRINKAKNCIGIVDKEITHQETLLTKLKQAILQEAIQGKLTADWRKENPNIEPGSQLLERIQKEKQHLIAKKKIRREKPQLPITSEEIPFEIPDSWEWCRLGTLIEKKPRNGISLKPVEYKTDTKTLKLSATSSGTFDGSQCKYLDLKVEPDSYLWLRDGDILIQRANSLELVGTTAVYRGRDFEFIYPDLMMKCRTVFLESTDYLHHVLSSQTTKNYFQSKASGSTGNMPKVSQTTVIATLIPLPPLGEQIAITKIVAALMNLCCQLETEIKHSHANAENLLQAVLKEAFTSKTV